MGAILDANVAHEVFSDFDRPEAGKHFFDQINSGDGVLVAGGRLLQELLKTSARRNVNEAFRSGRIKRIDDQKVNALTEKIQNEENIQSDDPHILALAQASGARLLYSNDADLQEDFTNKQLIDKPRGKVYSTRYGGGKLRRVHRTLLLKLKKKDLCGTPQ